MPLWKWQEVQEVLHRPHDGSGDGSRKHPEFIGTHRATGLSVAVEAKSRHRPGVLGFKGHPAASAEEHGADIRKLLLNALAKEPGMPFVVFIDVNLRGSTLRSAFTIAADSGTTAISDLLPHRLVPPQGLVHITHPG